MKTKTLLLSLVCALLAIAQTAHAQLPVGSHYPAGAEGIKGASLPPPGVYLRDYNFFYTACDVDGFPFNANVFVYVQAPRLIWMTDWTIFGATYGMDVIVPFAYKDVSLGGPVPFGDDDQFGLSDIQLEPLLLSWHLKQFDVSAAYAVWVPSGCFSASTPQKQLSSPGLGFWTHMFTLGGVWYPDEKKTWALSALSRYEINTEQDDTDITPGNMFTVDWGLSKTIGKGVDVGFIGYYQQLVTEDSGSGSSSDKSHVVGIGPEITGMIPKINVIGSLRYVYEIDAKDRPKGQLVTLTLTKRF
ncbi:MAG TPA: transporter [Verrucomicrobiota bacterium]|nr:transporter [Verrucomicrobiota bacterium]